jgi:KDO2-lipid IV(A) lauroyltransferase
MSAAPSQTLSRRLRARALILVLRLCASLSLTAARRLGRSAAAIAWPLRPASRRITERNVALAFPELAPGEQRRLSRDSFLATAETACEMGRVWLREATPAQTLVRHVDGEQPLRDALDSGRGVVVLAPHLGNWEVLGLYLPELGPVVSLYDPPQLPQLETPVRRARERSGARLVPPSPRGLADLVRSVRQGGMAGILPDQVPRAESAGRNVPFMGIPCFTGTLACRVIQRSAALAVFGFAERVADGFHIHFLPAHEDIYSEDLDRALRALNRGVETCLRRCPAQYQWEYKRFRERPARGPGYYAAL